MKNIRIQITDTIWMYIGADGEASADCERVLKHPFLLEVRIYLAIWRMKRRQAKLKAWQDANPS